MSACDVKLLHLTILVLFNDRPVHIHTHKHTHIYIYIYIGRRKYWRLNL